MKICKLDEFYQIYRFDRSERDPLGKWHVEYRFDNLEDMKKFIDDYSKLFAKLRYKIVKTTIEEVEEL